MQLGLGISEDIPLGEQQTLAGAVESAGLASLWTNEASGRDALLTCQAWAAATDELGVGTGVLPLWTRTPAQLAMAAATLQEATGGRLLLGLGVSHPGTMEPWHGADYRRPLTAVDDTVAILRQLLAGEEVDHGGAVRAARGLRLGISPLPEPAPLILAAMGPQMLELAGRIGDGVMLNWATPDEVARAGAVVRDAADGEPEVVTYVRVAVDADRDRARAALAREVGGYCALPAYAEHLRRQGLGHVVEGVKSAYKAGGAEAVPGAIADEDLLRLGWYGTPDDDPGPTLGRYADAGLDHLVARVVVTGADPVSSVRACVAALGPG